MCVVWELVLCVALEPVLCVVLKPVLCVVLKPVLCAGWELVRFSSTGDPDGIHQDEGSESKKLVESIKAFEIVYFVVWSQGPPRHYTYLKLFKDLGFYRVEYKDYINDHPSKSKQLRSLEV